MEQLVSKTDQIGRDKISAAPGTKWHKWPDDFPEAKEYLNSAAAKAGMQELVLTHQIYRLRLVRKSLGITQVQLAKKMGVSQIRISQIENGKLESFELGTLLRYIEALGGTLSMSVELDGKKLELLDITPDTLEVWGD